MPRTVNQIADAFSAQEVQPEILCVGHSRAQLGEGPVWSPQERSLYWVDVALHVVHRIDRDKGHESAFALRDIVSVVTPSVSGDLLVATSGGLLMVDVASGRARQLSHPESGQTGKRYNDGKCDRLGRLWIGSMDLNAAQNRGNLFRVCGDGMGTQMDSGFTIPNGIGWSPDNRRMYFTDTGTATIYQYDFELASGSISNRRPLIVFDEADGRPDGLTVDADGCLWVAMWDGWHIARISPDGRPMLRVRMPVPRPTSCCFGGDKLDTLFVTSASIRLSQEQLHRAPLSGGVFAFCVPGVHGLPESPFAG